MKKQSTRNLETKKKNFKGVVYMYTNCMCVCVCVCIFFLLVADEEGGEEDEGVECAPASYHVIEELW
jgi:hypothetical protein